jgi:DNA transformation protein
VPKPYSCLFPGLKTEHENLTASRKFYTLTTELRFNEINLKPNMTTLNNDLTNLPNIGRTLAEKLKMVGISTPTDLLNTGSENAMIKIKTIDKEACINMLFALEGAIQGIRWHNLEKSKKLELTEFYNRLK